MGLRWTCVWILVAMSTAGCVSERRDTERAPAAIADGGGEGGSEASTEAGDGGQDAAGGGADAEARDEAAACEHGEEQECIVEVGEQGGKKTCFAGSRRCRDGRWGPCHYVPGQVDDEG